MIKTDVPSSYLEKEIVHARYKDLLNVEKAFRTIESYEGILGMAA